MGFDLSTAQPVQSGFDLSTAKPVDGAIVAPAPQGGFAETTLKNIPKSAANFVNGIYQTVRHPVDTAGNLLDIGAGALQNALPDSVVNAINKIDPNPQAAEVARQKADAVGQFYKNRYGGLENIKQAAQSDPVGVLADAATVLTGGGSLATKVPGLVEAGNVLKTAGTVVNPASLLAKPIAAVAPWVGDKAAQVVGAMGTHTGGESIKQAFGAGMEGGQKADAFLDNMRGNVPQTDALIQAKQALDNMRQSRSDAYRSGMTNISGDKSVLDFQPIIDAVNNQRNMGIYKGKVINASTAETQSKIADLVNDWGTSDPVEYHTPEGLDALKKAVGDIRDSTQYGTPSRKVADGVYQAVKKQIVDQAPAYADVMSGYEDASDLMKEIEKSLSLGQKASADTALRKLQSITRNNVNTNYGARLSSAQQLEQNGAPNLTASLAGQALSSAAPRGLGNVIAPISGMGAYHVGGPAGALAAVLAQSPRAIGESAYYAGKLAAALRGGSNMAGGIANAGGVDPKNLATALYQLNQPKTNP